MKKSAFLFLIILLLSVRPAYAEERMSDGTPLYVAAFEELTGLSREKLDHIVIRSGMDGIGYSTSYDKVLSDIYRTINTKSFYVHTKHGNSGGWSYTILFFDKEESVYEYTIGSGLISKSGVPYRTAEEEALEKAVETAYHLIANDCSSWASDDIVMAKDLGFLEDVTDLSYKEPVTREKFCEIIYNMLDKTMDITWAKVSPGPFRDTTNEKIFSLCLADIVDGKGGYTFAPNDNLTREEAAVILSRVLDKINPDIPATEMYFEYNDRQDISQWASDSVQRISNLGIMNGVGENRFAPQAPCTAEQAIVAVIRLYQKNTES